MQVISSVIPRPIGFMSTVSAAGQVNLSPYSYFGAMGHDPPMVCMPPAPHCLTHSRNIFLLLISLTSGFLSGQLAYKGVCTEAALSVLKIHTRM